MEILCDLFSFLGSLWIQEFLLNYFSIVLEIINLKSLNMTWISLLLYFIIRHENNCKYPRTNIQAIGFDGKSSET